MTGHFGKRDFSRRHVLQASLGLIGGELAGRFFRRIAAAEPTSKKVRVVLVGDSTVTDASGWGKACADLVTPVGECLNFARSGRSSKSFYDEGHWKKALAEKPDYVLMQFGHNDQPGKGPERETEPETTYRANLERYVDEARAAGAKPVIVTSLTRRIFTPEGKIAGELLPYVEAARATAHKRKVPLVDLYAASVEVAERLGPKGSEVLGPPHPKLKGRVDGTHLSADGAKQIAPLVAQSLIIAAPELKPCFTALRAKP